MHWRIKVVRFQRMALLFFLSFFLPKNYNVSYKCCLGHFSATAYSIFMKLWNLIGIDLNLLGIVFSLMTSQLFLRSISSILWFVGLFCRWNPSFTTCNVEIFMVSRQKTEVLHEALKSVLSRKASKLAWTRQERIKKVMNFCCFLCLSVFWKIFC